MDGVQQIDEPLTRTLNDRRPARATLVRRALLLTSTKPETCDSGASSAFQCLAKR